MFNFLENNINEFRPFDDARDALSTLQAISDDQVISNATYFAINIPTPDGQTGYALSTYSDSWHDRYFEKRYQEIDPVVRRGLSQIVPFDWADEENKDIETVQFFGEAREFGVAKQGFSIPIRGVSGDHALFSINSDLSELEWKRYLREHKRDVMLAAFFFHMGVTDISDKENVKLKLSQRERETLKWMANGKTSWEAAQIMDVSQRTIEFYLANIRVKMRVNTTTQAVARATILGCIY